MATYAIGDLQGCLEPLLRLLDTLKFDPSRDRLWFAGDLVNRGPQSLEALRFVHSLGASATTILGNHDLHLLATWCGIRQPSKKDTLDSILEAPDCDTLCHWLRQLPLLHSDMTLGATMVHAGIYPLWTHTEATRRAREAETGLQSDHFASVLRNYYTQGKDRVADWSAALSATERLNFILAAFTQMRFVHPDGKLDFAGKLSPADSADHVVPWYRLKSRIALENAVVFGHWSTVGDTTGGDDAAQNVYAIDRGCVWGGSLAAIDLDTMQMTAQDCRGVPAPEN